MLSGPAPAPSRSMAVAAVQFHARRAESASTSATNASGTYSESPRRLEAPGMPRQPMPSCTSGVPAEKPEAPRRRQQRHPGVIALHRGAEGSRQCVERQEWSVAALLHQRNRRHVPRAVAHLQVRGAAAPPSRAPAAGRSLAAPPRHRARDFAVGLAPLQVLALVVRLLALGQREQQLGAAAEEVEFERNESESVALDGADQLLDLAPMQQELAGPDRIVIVAVALLVRRDVEAFRPRPRRATPARTPP